MTDVATNLVPQADGLLTGGGEMGARMRAFDWTATPLGPPTRWPAALATLVRVVLGSDQPMFIAWGPARTLLYNDRYAAILGAKHPGALARPFMEVWSEAAADLRPLFDRTFAGESIHMADIVLALERNGAPEEAHFAFSYTPIVGAGGEVEGLFCPCVETTDAVFAARRQVAERERLGQLFAQAPGFIAMLSGPSHVFEFVNHAYTRLVGGRDVVGRPARDALPELAGQGFFALLDRVYESGEAAHGEAVPIALDGGDGTTAERLLDFVYQPVFDADGGVSGIFVEGTDVTERVAATAALREALSLNASILNSSRDCILALDLEGHALFVSPGGIESMEVADAQAVIGRSWLNVWTGEARARAEAAIAEARGGGTGRFQGFCATQRGTPKWWDVVISRMDGADGAPDRLVSVGRDITEQKTAERALNELNDALEAHVDARTQERDRLWQLSADLLVVADYEGRLLRVSPSWTAALGISEADLLSRPYAGMIHPDDLPEVAAALEGMRTSGQAARFEDRLRAADGSWRWFAWTLSPDPGGERLTGVGRDITDARARADELEAAQDALRQSQKLEAVGQLTGGVAHDFNNLLTVIRGSIDLLRRPGIAEDRRQRYMSAISETVDRAAKLTGQLLAFARRQALQPEAFDVCRNVAALGDMLGTLTGARVSVAVEVPDAPCFVNADPSQFDTAIVNMAVNARDAMDGEGVLTIRVRASGGVPALRSHAAVDGDFVAVSLTDTGTGMPADRMDQIFEPFFTTKGVGHGTGLGLSQVFGFAKQSGGEVQVESAEGQGSTFTIYLPRVVAGAAAEEGPVDGRAPLDGRGACILVVEDNVDVGTFATQTLRELGYDAVLAADGAQALAELAKDADRFDAVFSDVVMPGMSGIELGHEIRRLHGDLPVVLTSGYSHVLAEDGTHGFALLQKPYSMEQLSGMLGRACRVCRGSAGSE